MTFPLFRKSEDTTESETPIPRRKRHMLCISNIDPRLQQMIKIRARQEGKPIYKVCEQLLIDGLRLHALKTNWPVIEQYLAKLKQQPPDR